MSFNLNIQFQAKNKNTTLDYNAAKQKRYFELAQLIEDVDDNECRRSHVLPKMTSLFDTHGIEGDIPMNIMDNYTNPIYVIEQFSKMVKLSANEDMASLRQKMIFVSKDTSKTPYQRVGECMHLVVAKLKQENPKLRYQTHRAIRSYMTHLLEAISFDELRHEPKEDVSVSEKIFELEQRWKQYTSLPFVWCNQFEEYAYYPGGNNALSALDNDKPPAITDEMVSELFSARKKFWATLSPKETLLLSPNYSVFPHQQQSETINKIRKRLLFAHALYEPFDLENAQNWLALITHNLEDVSVTQKQQEWINQLNIRVGKTFENVLSVSPMQWNMFIDSNNYNYVKAFEHTNLETAYKNIVQRYSIIGGNEGFVQWLNTNHCKIPTVFDMPNKLLQLTETYNPLKHESGFTAFYYSNVMQKVTENYVEPLELGSTVEPS